MIKLELNVKGNILIRDELKVVKENMINKIKDYPDGTIFYYDFGKIKGINSSGVDEVISKVVIYLKENEKDKFLILTNLNEEFEHRLNITYSLSVLGTAIVEKNKEGKPEFLGKISDNHKEILRTIYEKEANTARDIADKSGKKISLISTHLNNLYSQRLIKRREDSIIEGGRQFIYEGLF